MGEGGDLEDGLVRRDAGGKGRALHRAVDVADLQGEPGGVVGVERHEARAVGDELGLGRGFHAKGEAPFGATLDACDVGEAAGRGVGARRVGDR
jgi:hypothetical protein